MPRVSESRTSSSLSARLSRGKQESKNTSKLAEMSICHSVVALSKAGGSSVRKGGIEAQMVTTICGKKSGPNTAATSSLSSTATRHVQEEKPLRSCHGSLNSPGGMSGWGLFAYAPVG